MSSIFQPALFDTFLQESLQDVSHVGGARFVEFASHFGEALAFTDDDPIDLHAHIGQKEARHAAGSLGERFAQVTRGFDLGDGGVGLRLAFHLGHFEEQEPLVGEIAVKGGFRHARLADDIIDAGPFESIAHEDGSRTFQNLRPLAALLHDSFGSVHFCLSIAYANKNRLVHFIQVGFRRKEFKT